MPNWCSNTLTVTGPEELVERMRREVSSSDSLLDFELILPTPRRLFEGEGWYNWRVSNWGTKWEADSVYLETLGPQELCYRFLTAWSPPTPLLEVLGQNFPGLSLSLAYDEPGNGFMGSLDIQGGRVIKDECLEMTQKAYEERYGE